MPEAHAEGHRPDQDLARECRLLTRYLVDGDPTSMIVDAYIEAHRHEPMGPISGRGPRLLDRWVFGVAGVAPGAIRAADAYSRFFDPAGTLRRKLTLVLALLEHAPPFHTTLNQGVGGSPLRALLGVAFVGLSFAASVLTGILVFGPAHLISGPRPTSSSLGPGAADGTSGG